MDNKIKVQIRRLSEKIEEENSKNKWIVKVKGMGYKIKVRGKE